MKTAWPVAIAGTGVSIPQRIVTNAEFAQRIDTSDEWITQRTGIRERRMVAPGTGALDLAAEAGRHALASAGIGPEAVDLVIVSTITPDHPLPSTACLLQAALGCRKIPTFDMNAACNGFVWGAINGATFIQSGMAETVLVVGVDIMSSITDMEDRATCILFGDAAGAAVLRRTTGGSQFLAARMGADGDGAMAICIPAGGSREPASQKTIDERLHYVRMKGREVYKFAVSQMQAVLEQTLADAGVSAADVKLLVPHQSNLRIIESACEKLGFPLERVIINIDRYGNTSAASVPLALHEAVEAGRLVPGDLVMLIAFGAGLTWGSLLYRV